MNLESKHAVAIRCFLDSIGYRKWCDHVTGIVADVPRVPPDEVAEDTHLGTLNFRELARSINYFDSQEGEPSERT